MSLYLESPVGPLENQILDRVPVLANNWGFGVENGQPYFDTGVASPGQQAYLELSASGRMVMVAPEPRFLGLVGRPLPPNPPELAVRVGFTGTPLPARPAGWSERKRLPSDSTALPAGPRGWADRPRAPGDCAPLPRVLGWSERDRLPGDIRPVPANPRARTRPQAPVPPGPPNQAVDRDFTGQPVPGNPPARAHDPEFVGQPMPRSAPNRGVACEFRGRPLPSNPPDRSPDAEFSGAPMPANPPNRALCGPLEGGQ